ncbi:MAG: type II secretion system protein [Candidatus Sabulitectum sp.]|nr:type II secretion system protein [Candidatus Sabulitectum sp.]
MKKGFTLVEVAVASVIILIVLTALTFALFSFVHGGRTLELQQGAFTLARVEIAAIERLEEYPETGVTVRADTLLGRRYIVETTVAFNGENAVDVFVEVSSGDSVSIELTRRFYSDISYNRNSDQNRNANRLETL